MALPERWFTEECVRAASGDPPRRRSIPLFTNRFVERWISRAHPITPILWTAPLGVACVWFYLRHGGRVAGALGLFVLGWLLFSLLEYLLHRFVFHHDYGPTPRGKLQAFLTHGIHHAYPNDPMRLVAPILLAWPIAAVVAAAYVIVLGAVTASALFAGSMAGYVAYDWIHFYAHHARPRTRVGRFIKRYHLRHHFEDDESRYGVSSPLWDLVFGTYRATPRPHVERAASDGSTTR